MFNILFHKAWLHKFYVVWGTCSNGLAQHKIQLPTEHALRACSASPNSRRMYLSWQFCLCGDILKRKENRLYFSLPPSVRTSSAPTRRTWTPKTFTTRLRKRQRRSRTSAGWTRSMRQAERIRTQMARVRIHSPTDDGSIIQTTTRRWRPMYVCR